MVGTTLDPLVVFSRNPNVRIRRAYTVSKKSGHRARVTIDEVLEANTNSRVIFHTQC